jgi:hypothetical protein
MLFVKIETDSNLDYNDMVAESPARKPKKGKCRIQTV